MTNADDVRIDANRITHVEQAISPIVAPAISAYRSFAPSPLNAPASLRQDHMGLQRSFTMNLGRDPANDSSRLSELSKAFSMLLVFATLFLGISLAMLVEVFGKMEPDHAEYTANIVLEAEARARGFKVLRPFYDLDSRTFHPPLAMRMACVLHFISVGLIVCASSLSALAQLRMTMMKANLKRLQADTRREKPVERLFSGWGTGRTLAIGSWMIMSSVLVSYVGLLVRTAALHASIFAVACIMLFGTCVLVLPSVVLIRAIQIRLKRLQREDY